MNANQVAIAFLYAAMLLAGLLYGDSLLVRLTLLSLASNAVLYGLSLARQALARYRRGGGRHGGLGMVVVNTESILGIITLALFILALMRTFIVLWYAA